MNALQHIVFPESINETYGMYILEQESHLWIDGKLKHVQCLSFDTYFNTFSIKKWKAYTSIDNLYLCFNILGHFRIETYALMRDNTEVLLDENEYNVKEDELISIKIKDTNGQMIFFKLYYLDDSIKINTIYYATDKEPDNDIHLSAVICTFKKEKYVYNNLEKFKQLFIEYPELLDKFNITVADNGKTLDPQKTDCPNVSIFPNLNAGGAGGFARGMIEVMNSVRPYSHILVMDDDVEIIPNSILLTISFLEYIRPEFRRYFIGGAMLNIMYKCVKTASLEWWNKNKTRVEGIGEQNLNARNDILINDFYCTHENQHQAWWYCVIPAEVTGLDNLPYPLFFRHDDIDFSMRNHVKIILVNGICVWHEPFYKKRSIFPDYIQLRNMLALSAHDTHLSEKSIFKLIWKRFIMELRTMNYNGAEAYPDILEDILQGPAFFKNPENCAFALKRGMSHNEKLVPISEIEDETEFTDFYKMVFNSPLRGWKKLMYELTLNGHLLPEFMLKSGRGHGGFADYCPRNFYLRSEMVVIDQVNGKAAVRKRSSAAFWKAMKRMTVLSFRYWLKRGEIRRAFDSEYAFMTSCAFWKQYLGI